MEKIVRNTKETQIEFFLDRKNLARKIETNCGFLNHMLDLFLARAGLGCQIIAKGDIEVDYHHLTEDMGIVLGGALNTLAKEILTQNPIKRYGHALLPMDGSLALVALDFSGRGGYYFDGSFPTQKCGDFDAELVNEFFNAVARSGNITLHVQILASDNSHHVAEAMFKGFGLAVRDALEASNTETSTKGVLL